MQLQKHLDCVKDNCCNWLPLLHHLPAFGPVTCTSGLYSAASTQPRAPLFQLDPALGCRRVLAGAGVTVQPGFKS